LHKYLPADHQGVGMWDFGGMIILREKLSTEGRILSKPRRRRSKKKHDGVQKAKIGLAEGHGHDRKGAADARKKKVHRKGLPHLSMLRLKKETEERR